MLISSVITMVGSPNDRTVVDDPSVWYRPYRISGRRYHVTATAPEAGDGSGVPPMPGAAH